MSFSEIGTIPISAHVDDTTKSIGDKTIVQVSLSPLENLDCDEFADDICFWSDVIYKVERTNIATSVGPLSSPRLLEICPFKISYSMQAGEPTIVSGI